MEVILLYGREGEKIARDLNPEKRGIQERGEESLFFSKRKGKFLVTSLTDRGIREKGEGETVSSPSQ